MPTQTISRCGGSTGQTYTQAILQTQPDGFWKLNEVAGSTAADSSGNAHDATTRATFSDPTWGQVGQVQGDTSALFARGAPFDPGSPVSMSTAFNFPVTADFSMAGWLRRQDTGPDTILTFGTALTTTLGASIAIEAHNVGLHDRATFRVANGATQRIIEGDAPILAADGWTFLVGVVRSGVMYLYVNGAVQSTTFTYSFGAATQTIYLGIDATNNGNTGSYADVQYLAFWGGRALSALEIGTLYSLGV